MTPNPTTTPNDITSTSTTWLDRLTPILSFTQGLVPLLVAVIMLWWFGTVLLRMLGQTGPEILDAQWSRYTYLYNGLEALAYAAAGFLFGREVNRQRADRAEADAAKSQEIAFDAQSAAATSVANGQALATGVRALGDAEMHAETARAEGADGVPVHLVMLRRMADGLFPPEQGR
jgi:hypothetical protein